MQRRHIPRPPEEPTNYNLDTYRSTFGSCTTQDPRTWIRQGYVEYTDAASVLSDAIDQLSPFDGLMTMLHTLSYSKVTDIILS